MTEEYLKEILAGVARVDPHQISATTKMADLLAGSLGRARLDAELRARTGVSEAAVYRANTFAELWTAFGAGVSGTVNAGESQPDRVVLIPQGEEMAIGIDCEMISALPAVDDYWEDNFYQRMFTQQEIAYALLQTHPRQSLTAMWCAKEAVRKADARLANLDWARIEVMHDAGGKPSLRLDGATVPGCLSLSHTHEFAVAVFAKAPSARSSAAPPSAPPITTVPGRRPPRGVVAAAWLAFFLACASIALQLFR